jgi:hypothetical protein
MSPQQNQKLFETIFDIDAGYVKDSILSLKDNNFTEKFDKNKLAFVLNNLEEISKTFRNEARNLPIMNSYYNKSRSFLATVIISGAQSACLIAVKFSSPDNIFCLYLLTMFRDLPSFFAIRLSDIVLKFFEINSFCSSVKGVLGVIVFSNYVLFD